MTNLNDKNTYFAYFAGLKKIVNKEDKISELCQGKTVLDLGCIDHTSETAVKLGDRWLHERIKKVSKELVGVDILPEDIKKLNRKGYKIINVNVEKMDLGRKFDVIVAGDLIEHVSNVGVFLQKVKKHMRKDSIAIISTPNPFNVEQFLSIFLDNAIAVNGEHTAWLDPKVMFETVRRSGLKIDSFYWIRSRFGCHVRKHSFIAAILSRLLRGTFPTYERDYMVVLKKQG